MLSVVTGHFLYQNSISYSETVRGYCILLHKSYVFGTTHLVAKPFGERKVNHSAGNTHQDIPFLILLSFVQK